MVAPTRRLQPTPPLSSSARGGGHSHTRHRPRWCTSLWCVLFIAIAFAIFTMFFYSHWHDNINTVTQLADQILTVEGRIQQELSKHIHLSTSTSTSTSTSISISTSKPSSTSLLPASLVDKSPAVASQQIRRRDKSSSSSSLEKTKEKARAKEGEAKAALTHIHAVTYASHGGRDDRFCRAVESALRHNVSLTVLGWGVPWTGLSQKLQAAYDYAKSLPNRDIILFTDAFDVMFTAGLQQIHSAFQSLKSDIVFSAECGCWPHIIVNESLCFDAYPPAPDGAPYRYLNSGTWIGYAEPSSQMLKQVIREAGVNFTDANDQKLIADMYIDGRHGITLDFYNKVFQSMHMTLDKPLPHCDPLSDLKIADGSYHNERTGNSPSVLHFNGGGKVWHLKLESMHWYKHAAHNTGAELDRLDRRKIAVPTASSGYVRFSEMCGNYTILLRKKKWKD